MTSGIPHATRAAPVPPWRARVTTSPVGGLDIACLTRAETAALILDIVRSPGERPAYLTSANGQVLSQAASDPAVRSLFTDADLVSADGQPMVVASRLLSRSPIPERCATTDLFHDVSRIAPPGTRYFLLGAEPDEIGRAAAETARLYPHIDLCGVSHGFVPPAEHDALIARIVEAAPDILWVGLGVPLEQLFALANRDRLTGVKVIKTSGGLFNFLSGSRRRAPAWMQAASLEWLFRLTLEPRRLAGRYAWTNVHSLYLLLSRTR